MKNNKIFIIFLILCLLVAGYFLTAWQNPQQSDLQANSSYPQPARTEAVSAHEPQQLVKGQLKDPAKEAFLAAREALTLQIKALLNCHLHSSCPIDSQASNDPRADHFLRAKNLADKLLQYRLLHLDKRYFDQESQQMVSDTLAFADGLVQQQAIELMSSQAPNLNNAKQLIEILKTSYNAKIMHQSMLELQRYPSLQDPLDQLFLQSLQTGSFYVAREVAANIQPFLNPGNIASYQAVADQLPARSRRARLLKLSIQEYRLKHGDH